MRTVYSGAGADTTSTVMSALTGGNKLIIKNLFLIGAPEDPFSLWLTDWEAPILWSLMGTFRPASISRSSISSAVGLKVSTMTIKWNAPLAAATVNVNTANYYQLASMGFYDNWPIKVWNVYMPTPGDGNTYGAAAIFGGRVGSSEVVRGTIRFTVNSFLDVVNQYIPTNTIELQNTLASFSGAYPPAGLSVCPEFSVYTGSTTTQVYGDCTAPTPGQIFSDNVFRDGFLVFKSPVGNTLGRVARAILSSQSPTISGHQVNDFVLYDPLPWPPTAGVDTFYVSAPPPQSEADGSYSGFKYVPSPETGI